MRKLTALCFVMGVLLVVAASAAVAEPGSLDPSFAGDGKVLTRFGSENAYARAIAVQTDGKVVVTGSVSPDGEFALARYNPDGTLDPAFDRDGKVTTDFAGSGGAFAVAIQADGKIVAGGGVLARYNTDGSLDSTFDGDGVVEAIVNDLALQADGKIVVSGRQVLARYSTDGTLDPTFDGDGVVEASVGNVAIQADGRIVTIGGGPILTRYNTDGTLDTTFGGDGTVSIGRDAAEYVFWWGPIAVQTDGRIVTAARAEDCSPFGCDVYNMLRRFNEDGTLDATFRYGGTAYLGRPLPEAIAIQADGKIVAAGELEDGRFSLTRLNADGTLDTTFAGDGIGHTRFTPNAGVLAAVAIQADGKVIAVGSAQGTHRWRFALARYLAG